MCGLPSYADVTMPFTDAHVKEESDGEPAAIDHVVRCMTENRDRAGIVNMQPTSQESVGRILTL